jgi:L-threonylcarbamoyladenylate synthase
VLAFGPPPPGSSLLYQLSERAELAEAAARLFDGLRWLDAEGLARGSSGIAVSPIPDVGLGRAINDRLQRAAVAR